MNHGASGAIGALGTVIWFLVEAWAVITGPANLRGWVFMAALPLVGYLAARGAAWRLNRKGAQL